MIVSNTSPLIALAKIDALYLLKSLFQKVRIPPAVHRELLAKTGPEANSLETALRDHIVLAECPQFTPQQETATQGIGTGEQQAIVLAHSIDALLLIDEKSGRAIARQLGVSITGVVGVLIRAKESGLISKISPSLGEMRSKGYWLSDGLIELATRLDAE